MQHTHKEYAVIRRMIKIIRKRISDSNTGDAYILKYYE